MFLAWIVITLMIALVLGVVGAALGSTDNEAGMGFFFGFILTLQISFAIGVIYVVAHFVSRYW